jgi:polysaccharide biosynthesis protein PslH
MNILMLTPRFPYPPTRGDCLRAWGELEYLSRRHDVWLACVDHGAPQAEHLDCVRGVCRDVAVVVRSNARALLRGGLHLLGGGSLSVGYFADARLEQQILAWARRVSFDSVLVFSPEMARFAECLPTVRRVLDMNDVESSKWEIYAQRAMPPLSWLCRWEARRLAAAERHWAPTHDVCLMVNERERRKLGQVACPRRAAVVRTGLDLSAYHVGNGSGDGFTETSAPTVGFVGSLSYPPNVRAVEWFGREVWPYVKRAVPRAGWVIVGRDPPRSVRRWGHLPDVTVTGMVKDVRPYLAQMRVFACPVDGEIGVQTKLIEALAAGRPSVVTPEAAGGIDYDGDAPFLIASSGPDFAAAIVRLFRDGGLARQLSARARAVAEQNYGAQQQYELVERWLADGHGQPAPVPP